MKNSQLKNKIREAITKLNSQKQQLNEAQCGCPIPNSVSTTAPYGTYSISSCASCNEDCCDGAFVLTAPPVGDFVSKPTGGRGTGKPGIKTGRGMRQLNENHPGCNCPGMTPSYRSWADCTSGSGGVSHCSGCCQGGTMVPRDGEERKTLNPPNNNKRRKTARKLNELSASSLTGYFSDLTSDRGPSGVQVDDSVRADLIGLALPAIEQTKIDSPKIATLVSNLLILKNEYDTTDGMALKQQPEEVQTAVEYLSNKDALAAFKEITDIDEAIAAALKLGANPTEKIYTATAFPDGMRDSDFYKKAVEDGYSFILKPYLNGRSAQTLPVGDDGFMINESILRMKKLANII